VIGKTYGIPTVCLRYFNVYGPRQSLSNPYTGVAAIFMSRLKNGNPPIINEDGLQTRDFISVHDIARANILAMEKSAGDYESFNVGTGNPITIKYLAEYLAKLYGVKIKPEIRYQFRKGDVRHCYADITKIKSKLGFTPKVKVEDGLKELVEWSRGVKAVDRYDQAEKELKAKGLA
jgi:dTDP-L-rhamnose 4-epimerase